MDFYVTVCIVLFTQLILFLILTTLFTDKVTTCCFKSLVKSGSACLRVVFLLFTLSAMESLQLTALMGARPATLEELQSRAQDFRAKAKWKS